MLQRRGHIYTSRIVVPSRIRARWGRSEITRSLRTGDLKEARRRLALWEAHMGAFLHQIEKYLASMTREELDSLYRQYLATKFDEIEERLSSPLTEEQAEVTSFVLNDEAHRISAALAFGHVEERLPEAVGLAPQAPEEMQRRLARRLLEADLRATVAELGALEGRPLDRPEETLVLPGATLDQTVSSPLLSEVVELYCAEHIGLKKWSDRTADQSRKIFELVVGLMGDRPIHEITKSDIRTLGAQMLLLPTNMTKRFRGLTPLQVLEAVESKPDLPRLQPRSINKNYQYVRSLFLWAMEHDYLTQNPATILRDVHEGRAQDARKALDDDDIERFFGFAEQQATEPYERWVPRIMAFTGCRMGEAARLERRDVRQVDGLWVFDINADHPEKRVKTENSLRLIPVHPRLIELGLLDFVHGAPEGFLFPRHIRYSDDPKRSPVDLLSKQLSRWLRSSGVIDKKKQVQSLRETMATKLKDLGTPEYQIAEILGHENSNISTGRYGKHTKLGTLHDALAKVVLPI